MAVIAVDKSLATTRERITTAKDEPGALLWMIDEKFPIHCAVRPSRAGQEHGYPS
jgi:hypothetical protein